jgi:hypothetical protein
MLHRLKHNLHYCSLLLNFEELGVGGRIKLKETFQK